MSAPNKSEREKCWAAKDAFWSCLDANDPNMCKKQRDAFENSCSKTWVCMCYFYHFPQSHVPLAVRSKRRTPLRYFLPQCVPMGVVYALWLISIQMHICMSSQQWDLVYALWQEIPKLVYAFLALQPVVQCKRFLSQPVELQPSSSWPTSPDVRLYICT